MVSSTLSFKTRNILNKYIKFFPHKNISEMSQDQIRKYNNMDLRTNKLYKKLYCPKTKNISVESFIIPVSPNSTIGGYLFRKTKNESSLNSLIIYLHDGGWMLGNVDIYSAICSNICDKTGAEVLALDYRLSPENKFPTPVFDCLQAYLWAVKGARYWKVDPDKIYLMGHCAGANLAASVSLLIRDLKHPKPAGQILVDPITDCRMRTNSHEKYKNNPMLLQQDLNFFITNYQREPKDIFDPLFSPLLSQDNSRLEKTLILASELDPLYDDAVLYAKVLKDADTSVKFLTCNNMLHGFINFPKSDHWKDIMYAISLFVMDRNINSLELFTRSERKKREKI